jgi:hypothetical protein
MGALSSGATGLDPFDGAAAAVVMFVLGGGLFLLRRGA